MSKCDCNGQHELGKGICGDKCQCTMEVAAAAENDHPTGSDHKKPSNLVIIDDCIINLA